MNVVSISYPAGVIEFDATLSENHPAANVVTEHPVEQGADVTDHVRPQVDRVTFEVFVTNTPTVVPKTNLDGASGGIAPLDLEVPATFELPISVPGIGAALKGAGVLDSTQIVHAQTLQFDPFDRVSSVYAELKTLQEARTLLTIMTSLREYENFVIETLTAPRQAGEGDAMKIQVEAKQLRFVSTRTVAAPAAPVGSKKISKGSVTSPDAGPKQSLAVKAGKALGLVH